MRAQKGKNINVDLTAQPHLKNRRMNFEENFQFQYYDNSSKKLSLRDFIDTHPEPHSLYDYFKFKMISNLRKEKKNRSICD